MRFFYRLGQAVVAIAAMICATSASQAAEVLPRPAGKVILRVEGAIQSTNDGETAAFDRAMLEALGLRMLRTTTPWTEGAVTFEGVLMRDLLAIVGARGSAVRAEALNDYAVEIPLSDFTRYDVLLALKMNGRYMRVRDKGPIWIVYPRDAHPELNNPQVNAKWVWQLHRLRVE